MARVKSASFEDRLTLVEHLDELRSRIIFSAIILVGAMVVCFWQNNLLLDIANGPLPDAKNQLLTLSPTEPFVTTLTLVLYAAVLITLPVLLYQIYAFILPAMSPKEKRVVLPLLMMVPVLFVCGVVFAYYVVVPAAIKFLLNFNSDQFNIQIRAREYYSFFSLALISVGILFQIPVGILAVTRLGIVTPETLAKNRRYAILGCAVLAMLLPGTDPVTMLISMAPLVFLFEFSLVLARWMGRPQKDESLSEAVAEEAADAKRDVASASGDLREALTKAGENAKESAAGDPEDDDEKPDDDEPDEQEQDDDDDPDDPSDPEDDPEDPDRADEPDERA